MKAEQIGAAAKALSDKLTSDESDHLVTLEMTGNDKITDKYLSLLQDKYALSHTGGNQLDNQGQYPTNTGGDQTANGNVPSHTGKKQPSGPGETNTGNTTGKRDTGRNITVTPIPEGPNKDELAYLDKITQGEHASIRNMEGRPVSLVINDVQKSRPADILIQEDGRWVVKGSGSNIHIIEPDGEVVTSFKSTERNTAQRLNDGRWSRPNSSKIDEFKNKFSDYVRW